MNEVAERIKNLNGIIVGQHVGAGSFLSGWETYITALKTTTGRTPLLVGVDFGWGDWTAEWLQRLVDHYRAGGLVEISWHARNPFTGGPDTDLTRGGVKIRGSKRGAAFASRFFCGYSGVGERFSHRRGRPDGRATGAGCCDPGASPRRYKKVAHF